MCSSRSRGAAISLRGDFDEVQAGFQLDLSDFFFGGVQCHGSEGYLVVGGEGLYGALLGELAGDFYGTFGFHTGDDSSGRLTRRKEGAAVLQVATVHFFSLAVSGERLHYAVAGFFEVALCLMVERVLQGHVGGQADDEACNAEGSHEDGDKARAQVGYIPEFFGGCFGVSHALPGGTEAHEEVPAEGRGAVSCGGTRAQGAGCFVIWGGGVTG